MSAPFVLDASCAVAVVLPDEHSDYATAALTATAGSGALVPDLFWNECANTLLIAERRSRLSSNDADLSLVDILDMNLETRALPRGGPLLAIARTYDLTVYDANYALLAADLSLPLATLDKKLIAAARVGAFELWQPADDTSA